MNDIRDITDIRVFVDGFYEKIRQDVLLGPVFFGAINGGWQPHLDRMYAFWDSILFAAPGFTGNPLAKHMPLRIGAAHFKRWLKLFGDTIDAGFSGPVADNAKEKAQSIAKIFLNKIVINHTDDDNSTKIADYGNGAGS
jgi:hemoglobin